MQQRLRRSAAVVLATAAVGALSWSPARAAAADPVVFAVGTTQDIDSLNVTVGALVIDYEVWNLEYATLTDKAAKDFANVPGLAESWTSSNNGLTWTYKLRPNLKWSDGQALTADDIAYSINRSRDEEWINHISTTTNLDAKATDPTTLVITTKVPDPKLPTMDIYPVPKHTYEKIDANKLADYPAQNDPASGPFMVKEVKKGEFVRMVRNPNWYGPKPAMDEVVFRIFDSDEAQFQALKTGEIDAVDAVPVKVFPTLKGSSTIEPVAGNQGGFDELSMNSGCGKLGNGNPALKDVKVRQAINYAIDRKLLVDKVLNGYGTPGVGLPTSANPAWDLQVPAAQQYTYDPAKAKALLAEAGWKDTNGNGTVDKDGKELKLRLFNRPNDTGPPMAQFISGWLKDIGIATEIKEYDDTQLTPIIGKGEFDLFIWGWVPFVDPDPQLSDFTTDQVTTDPDSPLANDANWCNKQYDDLYQQQKVELDPAKRHQIVQQMLKIFYDDAPYAVLFKYDDLNAIRKDRWTNIEAGRQPANTGPLLFTNTSPAYLTLQRASGSGGGGSSNVGVIIAVAGGATLAVVGGGLFAASRRRRRGDDDDRE
jgi:peptide/nickel transport system substrate-binding protein